MPYEKVLAEIIERDENDRNKPVGALKLAEGVTYVDTSYLTIKEVCDKVLNCIK
jgi:cytidylate kinase